MKITTLHADGCVEFVYVGYIDAEAISAEYVAGKQLVPGFTRFNNYSCEVYELVGAGAFNEHATAFFALVCDEFFPLYGAITIVQEN